MKKTIKYFVILILALTLTSFNKEETSPKTVTLSFLAALGAGDFTKAKTMVTEDAKESIESLQTFAAEQLKGKEYVVTEELIEKKTAIVSFTEKGLKTEKMMHLINIKGEWKIMFDKINFTGSFD